MIINTIYQTNLPDSIIKTEIKDHTVLVRKEGKVTIRQYKDHEEPLYLVMVEIDPVAFSTYFWEDFAYVVTKNEQLTRRLLSNFKYGKHTLQQVRTFVHNTTTSGEKFIHINKTHPECFEDETWREASRVHDGWGYHLRSYDYDLDVNRFKEEQLYYVSVKVSNRKTKRKRYGDERLPWDGEIFFATYNKEVVDDLYRDLLREGYNNVDYIKGFIMGNKRKIANFNNRDREHKEII